jgi:hypothetical protein
MNSPQPQGFGGLMQAGMGGSGPGVQKRNPVMTLLIPYGAYVVAMVLSTALAGVLGGLASLLNLVGFIAYVVLAGMSLNKMASELKGVTGDQEIAPWMMWVPGVNNIMCMIKVHPLMERARQQRGIQSPAKPNWLYLLFPLFAFPSDLNDLA